jgi:hypothetical protein
MGFFSLFSLEDVVIHGIFVGVTISHFAIKKSPKEHGQKKLFFFF